VWQTKVQVPLRKFRPGLVKDSCEISSGSEVQYRYPFHIGYIQDALPGYDEGARKNMGRMVALLGFWLVGGFVGFLAWLDRASMLKIIMTLGLTSRVSEALLATFFGSTVMVLGAVIWSFLSSK
jgi:hypothetical protein